MGVGEDTGTCAETTSVPLVDCAVLVVVEGEVIPETSWLEVGAAVARGGGVDRNSGRYNPEDMRGREGEGMGSRIGEYAKVISSASEIGVAPSTIFLWFSLIVATAISLIFSTLISSLRKLFLIK